MQTLKVASDIAAFDFFPFSIFRVPAPIGLRSCVCVGNDTVFGFVIGLRGERAHPRDKRCAIRKKRRCAVRHRRFHRWGGAASFLRQGKQVVSLATVGNRLDILDASVAVDMNPSPLKLRIPVRAPHRGVSVLLDVSHHLLPGANTAFEHFTRLLDAITPEMADVPSDARYI
jgi:hypothetical protein